MRTRIALGAAGVLLGLFGVFRLLTQVALGDLATLVAWLVAALVLHDGVLSPAVAGAGRLLHRLVPSRARTVLQPALVVAGLVTLIALPMIHRQGRYPASKALLRQDYTVNLLIAVAAIAGVGLLCYLTLVVRAQRASTANERPPASQGSRSE